MVHHRIPLFALSTVALLLLCSVGSFADPHPANNNNQDVRNFTVSLDAPPEQRWAHILPQFKKELFSIMAYIKTKIPKALIPAIELLAADGGKYFGDEMFGEMRGIANCTGLDLGDIVVVNLFYELNSACTSIVAQRSTDNAIFHGRNLDYGIPGLQNVTMNIAFTRGDTTVFHTTTYGGYVGALTGMRPGAFSVSLDQRFTPDPVWENAIEALLHHGKSVGVALRELLETTENYADVLSQVQADHFMSVEYIIVGGAKPGEGAIVTRNRTVVADLWELDAPSRWFLVETNYDHWLPPPSSDNRRDPANRRMNATGSAGIGSGSMFKILSEFPNLNSETTYTTIMSATTGAYFSVARNL